MKKKILIIPSVMLLLSLTGCNSKNESIGGSHSIVDILLNASDGYTFENGKSSTYLHVHQNVSWAAVKESAPKKVKDLNGNYYDIPSKDREGNLKNYWTVGEETTPIPDSYVFTNNTTTLNAHIVPSKEITITLSCESGTWKSGGNKSKTYKGEQGTIWSTIKNDFGVTPPTDNIFVGFSKTQDGEVIPDTYVFNEDTNLYAKFVTTPVFTDFENDSWEIFNVALKSADPVGTLKEKYNKASLLGLKRNVTLWGVSYKVQIIGENTDTIYGTSSKAALTFQFEDAIETGVGFNNDMYNYYDTAAIRGYLNQSLINQMPDEVKDNIKVVSKRTYETYYGEQKVNQYPEKIFLPSFNEVGITSFKIGDMTIDTQEEGFLDSGTSKYNKPYEYYSDSSTATARRIKKYYENPVTHLEAESSKVEYWLRSVDYESEDSVYYITKEGNASTEGSLDADIGLAIAPCFCLGGN